jgi:RsiW-degrading membrane proteinase PrsW (M82 family)
MQPIPILVATLIPLIVVYVIRTLDLYQMGSFGNVLVSFFWGCAAVGLAFYVNNYINFHFFSNESTIIRFVAPVTEEILKALVLIFLVRRASFTYFVDGAIYGFAAGMGFAIVENYLYLHYNPGGSMGTAISRVIYANLVHASATALVGVSLGLSRFRRSLGKIAYLIGGLLLGMLLHGLFNNIVDRDLPGPMLLYSAIIGFAGVGIIAFIIFRGLAEQRTWIEEKLGMADRVTAQEAKIVHQLEDMDEILKPLRQQFGDKKAEQVEEFLLNQARLGIKRKTLDKLPDPKMRAAVEQEMADLRTKMELSRRKAGVYVMLYVRNIFPEKDSPLWNILNQRIRERKARGGPQINAMQILQQRIIAQNYTPPAKSGFSQNSGSPAEPVQSDPRSR